MSSFLFDFHGETNRLLKAVKADLDVPELVFGCRALGLFCKLLISPLWVAIEDKTISIIDMSARYTELVNNLAQWSADATPVLEGTARPFANSTADMTDVVLSRLLEPLGDDSVTLEILQVLFTGLHVYSARLLSDHLPGGCFHRYSGSMSEETASVRKTNAICESDFGQLDRFLREKPNMDTVAVEGLLMFSNNKTPDWLKNKSQEERQKLLDTAMHEAPSFREAFKDRRQAIRDFRVEELKKKQADIARKALLAQRKKEVLTAEVTSLGGLWLSEAIVREQLEGIVRPNEKRLALRSQLLFRKFVLQQKAIPSFYHLSQGGKQLSLEELTTNLIRILE